jgi:outer membrane protein
MKASIKTILAVVAMGATAIAAHAAGTPATPKVVTVDLGKAFASYYRTAEENAKITTFQQNAQKTFDDLVAEGTAMADKFKAAQATFNSPVSTDLAKQQAQAELQRIYPDIQKKEQEIGDFRQKALQQIQQNAQQMQQQLLAEIAAKAGAIGQAKGATIVSNRGALVYADPAMDITDEVIAALNQGHPMPAPAAPAPAQPTVGFPAR